MNCLLSQLPDEDYYQFASHLRPVTLAMGKIVEDANGRFGSAYFPTTCVMSLICAMENGAMPEVALMGNDGLLGTSLFLGGNNAIPNRAIVGIAGEALKMDAHFLQEQFARGGMFQNILLGYTAALIKQISLTAACNRMHTLEKRLCRWLLLIHDRASSNELVMTHEFIANMLGGRRETVTVAAGHLQDAGLIHYNRGRLRIVDRMGLENAVCECYRGAGAEASRLVGGKLYRLGEPPCRTRASNALS
jgi:hypothetical protein